MRSIEKVCSKKQSLQIDQSSKARIGHLLELQIRNFTVKTKYLLLNPVTLQKKQVVGLINKFVWNSGVVDPILLECIIPYDGELAACLNKHNFTNNSVQLKFVIYEYSKAKVKTFSSYAINFIESSPLLTKPKIFLSGSSFVMTGNIAETMHEEGTDYSGLMKGITDGAIDLTALIFSRNVIQKTNIMVKSSLKPDIAKLNKVIDSLSHPVITGASAASVIYLSKERRIKQLHEINNWEAHE